MLDWKMPQTQRELLRKILALRSWDRHQLAAVLKVPKARLDSWLLPETSQRRRRMKSEMVEVANGLYNDAAMLVLMSLGGEFTPGCRNVDGSIWCERWEGFYPKLYALYENGHARYTLDGDAPGARPIEHLDATIDDHWVTITCFTESSELRGFLLAARSVNAHRNDLHLYEMQDGGLYAVWRHPASVGAPPSLLVYRCLSEKWGLPASATGGSEVAIGPDGRQVDLAAPPTRCPAHEGHRFGSSPPVAGQPLDEHVVSHTGSAVFGLPGRGSG